MDFWEENLHIALVEEPVDTWGLAYDLDTHRIIDDIPGGWHSYSATLYRKIVRQLHHSDYLRQQYSVYIQDAVTAWETWLAGALLSDIEPRGIIQTTAQDLSLIRVPHRILYNITQHMVPGGALFPKPQGLTPVRVIADEEWQNFVRAPIVVQNIVQLPTGVHESDEAWNPENWRT